MELQNATKKRNPKAQTISIIYMFMGYFILMMSRIYHDKLNDFQLGFCESLSVCLLIFGTLLMIRCTIKKQKAFMTKKS